MLQSGYFESNLQLTQTFTMSIKTSSAQALLLHRTTHDQHKEINEEQKQLQTFLKAAQIPPQIVPPPHLALNNLYQY